MIKLYRLHELCRRLDVPACLPVQKQVCPAMLCVYLNLKINVLSPRFWQKNSVIVYFFCKRLRHDSLLLMVVEVCLIFKSERFLIDFGYYWSWRYSKTFSMSVKPSGSGFRPSNVSEAVKTTIKSHSKWKYIQLTIPNSSVVVCWTTIMFV